MKYKVIRTDTADAGIRKIILYVAQNFGNTVALEKLDEIEKRILALGDDPFIGTEPRYLVLKRQGYKILVLEKDLVFYKIDEENKNVVIYAVVDQRQDYLNILRGKINHFAYNKRSDINPHDKNSNKIKHQKTRNYYSRHRTQKINR